MSSNATSRVLVTGVTGFIASHVAKQLLEKGHTVIGTARTASKADFLKKQFTQYGDKFQIVEVKDVQHEGAFDEVVKDVDVIHHIASPFHFNAEDPIKDMMNPAVDGTINLLNAAYQHGNNVKHVVITSSVAAIAWAAKPGYTFTEKDWNDETVTEIQKWKPGQEFSRFTAYRASKNAAERAAWKFRDEKKPKFRLTTINPGFVFGPCIHYIEKPDDINTSVALLFAYFKGQRQDVQPPAPNQGYVDVRDVAEAHVRAVERGDKADGERFITVKGSFTWQQVVDILHKRFPEYSKRIPQGEPGKNYETACRTSGQKATDILGINYIDLEQTTVDTVNSLKQFW
ncbi:hypothetical protein BZG36_01839 [Bifiguratus adelaidae]|uniref:NAD-dependent epimerase/dehydratase domain-containing protein n=1 Tax=Bifiguratus adelaidae TaxID=1938954 RepID=A0A261Y2E2_9FUNG|nr:hypothetical protein BZG36_01839 [Bifiguratus adelaidae]